MSADGSGFEFEVNPSPEDLAAFPLNDLGNAKRLMLLVGCSIDALTGAIDKSGSRLLYIHNRGWAAFNGSYWDLDLGEDGARAFGHLVADRVRGLYALFVAQGLTAKQAFAFIDGCGAAGATTSMLTQAKSYLTVRIDAFDRDPLALNCLNGTLRLKWAEDRLDVRLEAHRARDRITKIAGAAYVEAAAAPTFAKVLGDSLRESEDREYFRRIMGYSSTGLTREQSFFVHQGKGADGKSTLIDAVREALGSYADTGKIESFLDGPNNGASGPQPELVKLAGDVRLVVLSEPKRGAAWNEGLLKSWTGGEPLTVRDLNKGNFSFRPAGKLNIQCNPLPKVRGDDDGIWRRLMPLLFKHQVPKEKIDKDIPSRIRGEELEGVLAWLVGAIGAYFRAGGLCPPASATRFLSDYRKVSSPFGDWLTECCLHGDEARGERVESTVLYTSYKEWSTEQGHDKPMSQRAFGESLNDRQVLLAGRNHAGRKTRGPIRLRTEEERQSVIAAEADAYNAASATGGVEADFDDESPFDAR
jgi:putative DNA primase/helicase